MNHSIAAIPGDGIGPEVTTEAIKVLDAVAATFNHTFPVSTYLAGGAAIDETGECLPASTVEGCLQADAVLLGAVGGDKWDKQPRENRPETALLGLRKALGLYANIRPAIMFDVLSDACPLKPQLVEGGLDLVVVRELIGGIYFGEKGTKQTPTGLAGYDVEIYSEGEVRRIGKAAFELAMKRNKKVTSVDKANVLESSRLWRRVIEEVALDYPQVVLNHLYVDNAAMQLVINPKQFDVLVTGNMFGDILSDEASMITGSIGMLPSASLADQGFGMYEPVHGSAPDIAGQNLANPMAAILSVGMMLKYSFGLSEESDCVTNAVKEVLRLGYRTPDLMRVAQSGKGDAPYQVLGTKEMGSAIAARIKKEI